MEKQTDWIQTFTGKMFYPLEPDTDLVCLEDVAHALSLKTRYNGHCSHFYSVAQHSVLMSHFFTDPKLAMWAMLHDAGEAYLADIPRPLKRFTWMDTAIYGFQERFKSTEDRVMRAVLDKLAPSLTKQEPEIIKEIDTRILLDEALVLMNLVQNKSTWGALKDVEPLGYAIKPWDWEKAKSTFLNRYNELVTRI